MASPILEAIGLGKTFVRRRLFAPATRFTAVRDVSFRLAAGETLAVVGESGSGKSTIGKMLVGLYAPSAGQILVDGAEIGSLSQRALSRRVQMVFQDPMSSLNNRRTVFGNIALPLDVQGVKGEDRRQRVEEVADVVQLPRSMLAQLPRALSGGQRQRVAIARALVTRPPVIVCDEPTSSLDVSIQAQILNLFAEIQKVSGTALLFISHDLAVVSRIADNLIVMSEGNVVEQGPAREIFSRPSHPYTRELLLSAATFQRPA